MKKIVICFLMLFVCTFVQVANVQAVSVLSMDQINLFEGDRPDIDVTDYNRDDNFDTNCADLAKTLRMGGLILLVAKIVLPLIIIAKSTFDLGKLAISGNASDFPKQAKKMGVAIASAIVIFFLPTLVHTVFSFIGGFEENRTSDSKICVACIFDPNSTDCTSHIE